jgi:fluoride exporter
MPIPIAIALGGALGSWLRYALATEVTQRAGLIGAGTFAVNLTGAFLLGLLLGLVESRFPDTPRWVGSGLSIGVLGGFTTFSSYTMDAIRQVEEGQWVLAILYLAGTVALGLMLAVAGLMLGRAAG